MRLSKFKVSLSRIKQSSVPMVRSFVFLIIVLASLFVGLEINKSMLPTFQSEQQTAVIYTESEALAMGVQGLVFSDWKLDVVIIDEPTEWEIKTLAGRGAHLILVDYKRMEDLNKKGLLEKANLRVPLFSYLATDFKKAGWEKVFLPLFWKSVTNRLSEVEIWGLSVPRNTPDRKLSWKAFYEIVGHPLFKAKLAGTNLGLTLEEFEDSPIPQNRKPGFVRQKSTVDTNK